MSPGGQRAHGEWLGVASGEEAGLGRAEGSWKLIFQRGRGRGSNGSLVGDKPATSIALSGEGSGNPRGNVPGLEALGP